MKKQKRRGAKVRPRRAKGRRRTRTVKAGALSLSTSMPQSKLHTMKIGDFYRPLKKPVTLRLDADVIAWFKKDGTRYQTRINAALRKVMEREAKAARG